MKILELRESFPEILMADYWYQPAIILFTWQLLLQIFPLRVFRKLLLFSFLRLSYNSPPSKFILQIKSISDQVQQLVGIFYQVYLNP